MIRGHEYGRRRSGTWHDGGSDLLAISKESEEGSSDLDILKGPVANRILPVPVRRRRIIRIVGCGCGTLLLLLGFAGVVYYLVEVPRQLMEHKLSTLPPETAATVRQTWRNRVPSAWQIERAVPPSISSGMDAISIESRQALSAGLKAGLISLRGDFTTVALGLATPDNVALAAWKPFLEGPAEKWLRLSEDPQYLYDAADSHLSVTIPVINYLFLNSCVLARTDAATALTSLTQQLALIRLSPKVHWRTSVQADLILYRNSLCIGRCASLVTTTEPLVQALSLMKTMEPQLVHHEQRADLSALASAVGTLRMFEKDGIFVPWRTAATGKEIGRHLVDAAEIHFGRLAEKHRADPLLRDRYEQMRPSTHVKGPMALLVRMPGDYDDVLPFGMLIGVVPDVRRTSGTEAAADAAFQLAKLAIAQRLVELSGPSHDTNLPSGVVAYLSTMPLDPFDRTPIKWNGHLKRFYSVGFDEADDGGEISVGPTALSRMGPGDIFAVRIPFGAEPTDEPVTQTPDTSGNFERPRTP